MVKRGNYLLYVIKEVGKPVLNWQQFRNKRKCFFIKQLQCGTQCPQGLVKKKQHTGSNGDQRNEQWIHATKHMSVSEAATQLFVRSWKDRAGKENSKYTSIFWGPFPIPLSLASAGGRILGHNNLWSNLVWQLLCSHKFHWASQIIESFSMFIVTVNNRTRSFLHDFLFCTDDLKGRTQLPQYNSHSSKCYGNQTQPLEYYSGFTYQQWRHKGLHRKLPVGSSESCIFLNRVRLQCSNPLQLFSATSLVLLLAKKPLSNKAHQNPRGLQGVISFEHSVCLPAVWSHDATQRSSVSSEHLQHIQRLHHPQETVGLTNLCSQTLVSYSCTKLIQT